MSSSREDMERGQKLPHGKPLVALDHGLGSSSPSPSKGPSDNPPPSAATGNGLPSVNMPRGGGAIRGIGERFSVSPATGTATAAIPLPITPGRSGFTPDLSLSYDSGAGNGPFGFGWQLGGLPSVGRKTELGLPRYDDAGESDTFVITGAEDLVPVLEMQHDGTWTRPEPNRRCVSGREYVVTRYRPRIENSFSRIERWVEAGSDEAHWRSISRSNQTTVFGEDARSRVTDPDDPSRVFRWLASRAYDDRGNAMVFEYKAENSEGVDKYAPHEAYRPPRHREAVKYLKRIKYGNRVSRLAEEIHAGSRWMFELVFDYGEHDRDIPLPEESCPWSIRTDPFSSLRSGFELRSYRLCQRVLMFHHFPGEVDMGNDTLVGSLDVTYHHNGFERSTGLSSAACASSFQKISYLRKEGGGYMRQSLPPVELEYSEAVISETTTYLSTSALEGIPLGIQGNYQFLDLDGEGVPGILAHHAGSYYYKANLGEGNFAAPIALPHMPTLYTNNIRSSAAQPQWLDLLGDGRLDMVRLDGPIPGFYKRAVAGGDMPAEPDDWQPFKPFRILPNLRWQDPNTKFIDLTGDGHADILITADEQVFTIYPSLQEDGFGPPTHWRPPLDENKGPRLLLEDGTRVIYTADMSGDGLSDLVRIGYHEVCYWPSLGYGRFGHKVVMSNAPLFDSQDHFRQSRLRLADIDGSGTTDLIYLGGRETMVYLNQAGNGWTQGHPITAFPTTDDAAISSVQVIDLLARGTACLVWSSAAGSDRGTQVRYVDLMKQGKPYLMTRTRNNLGSETRYRYASSAKFYLADKAAGEAWVTRLPFPVHVVEHMDSLDRVSRNRFTTQYGYHSGHYDGVEKEFRGFGMVETWDTEDISALREDRSPGGGSQQQQDEAAGFGDWTNWDNASTVPPVLTKTWFHTGICFSDEEHTLEAAFGRQYHPIDLGRRLPSSALPSSIRVQGDKYVPYTPPPSERREAFRALKGSVLHSEIYSLDGTPQAALPYTVNQANFLVELLQPGRGAGNPYAVFHMRGLESVQATYDRQLYPVSLGEALRGVEQVPDPRMAHSLTLEADEWGNVLRAVALSYGRQFKDASNLLSERDHEMQRRDYAVLTENAMTNAVVDEDNWLTPLAAETKTYELFNVVDDKQGGSLDLASDSFSVLGPRCLLSLDRLRNMLSDLDSGAFDLPFEDYGGPAKTNSRPHRRLVQHVQSIYRSNDLSAPLPLGTLESLALPFQNRQLAISTKQMHDIFVADGKVLADEVSRFLTQAGGYVHGDDGNWWTRTARMFFSPDRKQSPAEELEYARSHFFLAHRAEDVFSTPERPIDSVVLFDEYKLLVQETIDPLGNRTVVGEVEHDGDGRGRIPFQLSRLRRSGQNYRLLRPCLVTDPNGNRSEAAYDVMGMLAGSAVMGKLGESEGDSLEGFLVDVPEQTLQNFFEAPLESLGLLGKATSRVLYDYHAFYKMRDDPDPQPVWSAVLSREKHMSQLTEGEESRVTLDMSYSDGFGRVIQHKVRAEPGLVPSPGYTTPELGDDNRSDSSSDSSHPSSDSSSDNESTTTSTVPTPGNDQPKSETRWIGSGWTVYNNKGSPVRQYEPFFTSTHRYQAFTASGVSPILFYDPIGRAIATLSPDHTWTKVRQDPWRAEQWDANDTVLVPNPAEDADVGPYFRRLMGNEYLPTWYTPRIRGDMGKEAEKAARRAAAHAATPRTILADALGRTFAAFEMVKTECTEDSSRCAPTTPTTMQVWRNDAVLDVQGNQQKVHDSLGRLVGVASYSYGGGVLKQIGLENGARWVLTDVLGKTIFSWDGRGYRLRMVYDELRRLTAAYLSGDDSDNAEMMVEQMVYGDSRVRPEETNARLRVTEVRDQAGVTRTEAYDFMGNILRTEHQLAKEYRETIDWAAEEGVVLEEETHEQSLEYDALSRVTATILPDRTVTKTMYNIRGLQESVSTWFRGEEKETKVVLKTEYNARGQRTRSVLGNGTTTINSYDTLTFRVLRIATRLKRRRSSRVEDGGSQLLKNCRHRRRQRRKGNSYERAYVQDLRHTYDAAGNLSSIVDASQQSVWHRNARVDASQDFIYDSTYRLVEAWGREHLGVSKEAADPDSKGGNSGGQSARQDAHVGDGRAVGRYVERYHYDLASNILRMEHRALTAEGRSWTRHYGYEEPSELEAGVMSNRLSWTRIGRRTERYGYSGSQGANGAMTAMPKVPDMRWNFRDQLAMSSSQRHRDGEGDDDITDVSSNSDSCTSSGESDGSGRGRGLASGGWSSRSSSRSMSSESSSISNKATTTLTYYRYDYSGKRVRKVSEADGPYFKTAKRRARLKETIYVGGAFEIFRKYRPGRNRDVKGKEIQASNYGLVEELRLELQTCQILGASGGSGNGSLPILRAEFMTVDSPGHSGSHRQSSRFPKVSSTNDTPRIQAQVDKTPLSSSSTPSSSSPLLTPSSSASDEKRHPRLLRYQYSNLQGSSTLEMDENGHALTREEYTPFGSTSYSAAGSAVGSHSLPPKRFRYAGAERDDATGLYCMGARYYATSLGRWTSADPSGLADGLNSYVYARCNPVAFTDPSGHMTTTSRGALLQSSGKRHDQAVKQIAELLKDVGIDGDLEVVVKSGDGGSRLDWLRKASEGFERTSIEFKTADMSKFFKDAGPGVERTVLDHQKVAKAVSTYVRQVNRHSGHLGEFLSGILRMPGPPVKREALLIVAHSFDAASKQFKEFSDVVVEKLAAAAKGPVASAVIHESELLSAVGGDAGAKERVTKTAVGLVERSEAAAKAAKTASQSGSVSLGLLFKGLGTAGLAASAFSSVTTLNDSRSTTAQKESAGLDLVANFMALSGTTPVAAAGAGLSMGGFVGPWVDDKVEAAVTRAGGTHENAAVAGAGAGVLAGAAAGAAVGAVMGLTAGMALGPGGALAGAAIGGAAGAIGAALKISWGS